MIRAFFTMCFLLAVFYTIGFKGCFCMLDSADCMLATAYAEATPDEHHPHHRSCDHLDAAAKRKAEHAAR